MGRLKRYKYTLIKYSINYSINYSMKTKDIVCMFLLLLLIYLVMKPSVEGFPGQVNRQVNTSQMMRELVPVQHSSR